MRLVRAIIVIVMAAAGNIGSAAIRDERLPSNVPELEKSIVQILLRTKTPGAAVTIVSRDKVLWAAGIGKADLSDGSQATSDTLFRIGSITKSLVALSVMMLVEEGKLSLDDRLAWLAPELEFSNPWESTDPVRIVHLLEHTAGWNMHSLLEAAYDKPIQLDLRAALAFRPATRTSRWKPGTGFAYSNIGAPVAAYIVERLTGERFEDLVAARIFKPFGMRTATFFMPDSTSSRLATGYDPHLRRVTYRNLLMRPAGAVSASARDMAALVRLYLNRGSLDGRKLVNPESIDRIELPTSSLAARKGIRTGYGLFNHTRNFRGFTFHGHTGLVEGYGAEMYYLPDAGIGYAFMINNSSGAPFYQLGQLMCKFVTKDLPSPDLPQAPPASPEQLSAWDGYYEPQNPPIEFFKLTNRLMGVMHVQASGGRLTVKPLLGGSGRELVMSAEGQFRPKDSALADTLFTRDEGGARLMVINQGSIFREMPRWQALGRAVLGLLCPVLAMSPVLFGIWWIPRCLLGKGPKPLYLTARILPVVAASSFAGMIGLSSITSETVWKLACFSPYSAGLFVLSLLFPAASILGLAATIRAAGKGMPRNLWLYLQVCTLSACFVSVYIGLNGFVGLRTWQL